MKPVAIQLYTVREAAAKDFPGVLKKIADIGYKGVEPAGLHGMAASEVAKIISDLGMVCCSSHTGLPTKENVNQLVDQEKALGNKRVITGFGANDFETEDACKRLAEKFTDAAELLKPHGMELGYHNHWWEFKRLGDKTAYEVMFENVPENVFAEVDVYWVAYGKADPVKIISGMTDRVPLLHIKDGPLEENKPHTAVGAGKLDMAEIIAAADTNVLDWLIVELDSCATDMMQAVVQSYKYLTSQGLAEGNK